MEHFGTPLPLTVLDMADWAREFSKYPKAQQLHMVPPVQLSGPGPISFSFGLAQSELPRLLLRSENGERTVQLQADRFGFGWARNVPIGETRRIPWVRDNKAGLAAESRKFRAWCAPSPGRLPRAGLLSWGIATNPIRCRRQAPPTIGYFSMGATKSAGQRLSSVLERVT